MFKRKKKSPSAKDIAALAKKENANLASQSYSSLPKSMYSGNDRGSPQQATPTRSVSGGKGLNLQSSNSHHDVRANSPLDLPMETLQSISAAYNLGGRGYSNETYNSAAVSTMPAKPLQSRSPYQSPVHASNSNTKHSTRHRSLEKGEFSGLFSADTTLERQFERLQMLMTQDPDINASNTMPASRDRRGASSMNYARERSQEREQYPHMGARSLEREHLVSVGGRSRSTDRPDYTSQLAQTQEQFRSLNRDSLILELQSQITDLNKDCAKLQQELDSTKDKLSSTMNSIKTFWSPELKKERSLRKEESAKYSLLNEQYRATQAEVKKQSSTMRELQSQIRSHQQNSSVISKQQHDNLTQELDDQSKEVRILHKTVDEMELRLETQKQTLDARDGSIKKLLEMLQSKGLAADKIEESQKELEKVRVQKIEDQKKIDELQRVVNGLEKGLSSSKESNNALKDKLDDANIQLKQQPASTHTMQAIMEAKDSRISALEKELQILEDRFHRFGEERGTSDISREGSLKEILPAKEKALKGEIDNLKDGLSSKENEIMGLKLKSDTLKNQQSEHQHYINVLKDQISAKEQQASMFQADIEDLRERLKDKDGTIDKKSRHGQTLQVDKRRLEVELSELRDSIDIKERKIAVLQRKIENLEDLLSEKEDQLKHINSCSSASTDSAISSMEESISDKDRQIERLKEQREIMELEHQEECDHLTKSSQQLTTQLDGFQLDITDKQTELCELREEVSELKSARYKADTRLRQLETSVAEKDAEITRVTAEVDQLKAAMSKPDSVTAAQLGELGGEVEQCQTDLRAAQAEVDRLLDILRDTENEKNDKENQLKDLQEIVNQYKQKFGTLKRIQQTEKKKSAHLLEEARKREEDITSDTNQLKGTMKEKEGRIEELEEALRESVAITAEREMVMMEQKMQIDASQSKIEELKSELLVAQEATKDYSRKLSSYVKQLEDKDAKLKRLQNERHKHLEEVFDMKQEALQAAICEKDANIALLEMTSTKKQRNVDEMDKLNREKDKLALQLKELAENRSRYHQDRSKGRRSQSREKTKTVPSDTKAVADQIPPTETIAKNS